MALLCRRLCWRRATAYVHHKPHTAPFWGCACLQNPEHTITCTVFSQFAIYLKFMHIEFNATRDRGQKTEDCTVCGQ